MDTRSLQAIVPIMASQSPSQGPREEARSAFKRIAALLDAQQPVEAEAAALTWLANAPNDPNILRLLGVALTRQNKVQEAIERLVHVTRLAPTFAPAYENLAEALLIAGTIDKSVEALQTALKHNPGLHSAQIRLAEILSLTGKGEEADAVFQKSFDRDPERAALVEAMDLGRKNKFKEAGVIYRDILRRNPDHVDALRMMGVLQSKQERFHDAEAYFRRATELAPDFWTAWVNLGASLNEQQKFEKAEKAFTRALKLRPRNVHTLEKLGSNCLNEGRMEDAVGWLKQALEVDPKHFPSLLVMGHALKTIGQQEEAIDAYRRCAEAKPDFGEVYWSLANLKTYRFDDADVAEMQAQIDGLGDTPEDEDAAISFNFALGKAFEDRKDYSKAFEYYASGNSKKRLKVAYDPIDLEAQVERLMDVFTTDFFAERAGQGCPDDAPIFIVGLPRSGSTLLEQILASHSDVEGTAELHYLLRIATDTGVNRMDGIKYPQSVLEQKAHQLRSLGEEYLQLTKPHRTGARHFTDKLPNNFIGIGFLHAVLPNAKVIDARRHPLDSCLGGFKQLFARGQTFTYDMYDLAHYYSQYVRIMKHWDAVLPGKVLRVNYEEVVADIGGQARRIAGHCGLEWQDAMLRFYETKRAVKTASSEQVRQPIYSGSVNLWRHYEEHLSELIEYLEPVLMDLPEQDRPDLLLDT